MDTDKTTSTTATDEGIRGQRWEMGDDPEPTWAHSRTERAAVLLGRGARTVANTSVKNLAAIFALAGLIFYLVGLTRRVAILEAERIPTTRGIPVSSLQDYLVQGLAVVIEPATLFWIFFWGVLVGIAFASAAGMRWLEDVLQDLADQDSAREAESTDRTDESRGDDDRESTGGSSAAAESSERAAAAKRAKIVVILIAAAFGLLMVGAMLFFPPALWGPWAIALVPLGVAAVLYKAGVIRPVKKWTSTHASLLGGCLAVMLIIYLFSTAWLAPPSLDTVVLELKSGDTRTRSGSLLASTNGVIYMVEAGQSTGVRPIVVLPLAEVRSAEIGEGRPRRYTALVNVIGLSDEKWSIDRPCVTLPVFIRTQCEEAEREAQN